MAFKDFFAREKHVALHAQPRNFRIGKWIGILVLMASLIAWRGIVVALTTFFCLCLIGICGHFFLRWKTEGWTKSWGPYTRIPLNGESATSEKNGT